MNNINDRIEKILTENKTVLFMKGTPDFPQCGFSQRAVAILGELQVPFFSVNILEDEELRSGMKEYGIKFRTFPQLYHNKELVGGSDIMMDMFEDGQLKEELAK
ncbi:MAG: monothiol glutaredoxin, Grx4 family [Bdellovibrionales bacterium CG10_big_fil_rev_8_21_14_0_10_45_34]|nr:MAG: monothiol glutaredoxin, Grx4 family [Bdellovibrionales bacterium CG10_big_fil_rev_8_21_14_0_10_45_34]